MQASFALALLLLALPAPAQDAVIVVDAALGPGADFATLEDALAAAGKDDLILVRSGYYRLPALEDFEIEQAVRVVAEEGASVALGSRITISGLGADETVVLRGLELDFTPLHASTHPLALSLFQNSGLVWVEDCRFVGPVTIPPDYGFQAPQTVRVDASRLVLRGCAIVGGGIVASYDEIAPLWMRDSEVMLHGSVVRCHDDPPDITASPAIRAEGSLLFVSGSAVQGGKGVDVGDGGLCGESGGPGILLAAGGAPSAAFLLASDVAGGPPGEPGTFPSCPPVAAGPPVQADHGTVTELPGSARSLAGPATATAGATVTLALQGEPGVPVVLGFSTGAASAFDPALSGALLLAPPLALVSAGLTGPAGALAYAFAAPAPAPGTETLQIYAQAAFMSAAGSAVSSGSAMAILVPGL